jgi:leucyl aminopeptidase (aminopeptidase T)
MKAWEAARNALENVLEAVAGERIVIICDEEKKEIGQAFAEGALALGLWTRILTLETGKGMRGEAPPQLLEVLGYEKPEVYVNLMRGQREETPFRMKVIKLETRDHRARLGHCPGVTKDMLTEGALALTADEHQKMQVFASNLMNALEGAAKIELQNPSGTRLLFSVEERPFFTDTKLNWRTMKWMNLPTGEVIVAPVEFSLQGRLVCDMAIGGVGPLKSPVEIVARDGKAEKVQSKDNNVLKGVKETLATDDWSDIVGEFAFGINPKARFVEEFLEAEKIFGTVHVAFGGNLDFPCGKNESKNHLDFLMSKPTVKIIKETGKAVTVMDHGRFKM